MAIAQSGPYITQLKAAIEKARGNPDVHPDAVAGLESLTLDSLLASQGVQHSEQLSVEAEARTIQAYKIATGQLTPLDDPLERVCHEPQSRTQDDR